MAEPNPQPTKLGAITDATVSRRSSIFLSSVFRSHVSMRSFGNLGAINPGHAKDQLTLTQAQKDEEFNRELKVTDPQAPQNLVRLKFSTNTYEEVQTGDSIIVNASQIGRIGPVNPMKVEEEAAAAELAAGEEEEEDANEKGGKLLRNQFNFSDRATQGAILVYIDQGTLSEAPTPKHCKGVTNQREIAAAYSKDRNVPLLPPPLSALAVTRIMERVVNQNMDPNACLDFKYFDDARDTLSRLSGYTLPLWEFKAEALTGYGVTAIRWNPGVPDLFAATYSPVGQKGQPQPAQLRGYLCTWTLKNQSTPRNFIELTAPASSIDWNTLNPSIIAAGSTDGNVAIYDVRSRSTIPTFTTLKNPEKHTSGVTVVRWQPPDASGNLSLLTAGLDGRILQWNLIQNEMKVTEISQLPAGVVSLDYYNESSTHFTVACDDGRIYQVLRTRTTQPPTSFDAHSPPVLALSFNRFHQNVYATCGTDWCVNIWREEEEEPLQAFDYAPYYANDVMFAPHSSTIFATVTSDGELFIYDLAVKRYEEICKTEVVEANDGALTSVRFHPKYPIILVGDDKGRIHSMKLSPNIRRNTKIEKEEEARNKLSKSSSSRGSRGLLPDLTQQPDEDDDGGNPAAEEEARIEAMSHDESEKFEKAMGVSWIVHPEKVSALPTA
ncbi:Dynein intermediate chain 2, ciliary-related protein [Tritrichomonas foetus]|uniref:Dynein intermediate chain 2, ciliary-related protein n=1 Tax=Tritrichomonas foetus TaxID=1144522 RepID=A0A1J4KRP7_9EUKA|nr:Dynein intermediate chain 2, ciliary-related protein [Tritrichomonas foetus]|eukprot:OHT12342.1 Dynein intermediate chain 2, ciliary-related protein [Tritrichomonas foetus]